MVELRLPPDDDTPSRESERTIVADWFANRPWAFDAGGRISKDDIDELLDDLDAHRADRAHSEKPVRVLRLCIRCAGVPLSYLELPFAPEGATCSNPACGTTVQVVDFPLG